MNSQLRFLRLSTLPDADCFDCGNGDLNEFFLKDAILYTKHLIAVTYVLMNDEAVIGFFSVLNDKIAIDDARSKTFWRKKVCHAIPFEKRYDRLPAVKIGRLAIQKPYQGTGYGQMLLDYTKHFFIKDNKTGCRFVTLDAYNNPEVIAFYQKNGFQFLTTKDTRDETRLMYYDLCNLLAGDSC